MKKILLKPVQLIQKIFLVIANLLLVLNLLPVLLGVVNISMLVGFMWVGIGETLTIEQIGLFFLLLILEAIIIFSLMWFLYLDFDKIINNDPTYHPFKDFINSFKEKPQSTQQSQPKKPSPLSSDTFYKNKE